MPTLAPTLTSNPLYRADRLSSCWQRSSTNSASSRVEGERRVPHYTIPENAFGSENLSHSLSGVCRSSLGGKMLPMRRICAPTRPASPRCAHSRDPCDRRGPGGLAVGYQRGQNQRRRGSQVRAHDGRGREFCRPAHGGRPAFHLDVAPIRTSSCTCMKRFSKMFPRSR